MPNRWWYFVNQTLANKNSVDFEAEDNFFRRNCEGQLLIWNYHLQTVGMVMLYKSLLFLISDGHHQDVKLIYWADMVHL